MKISHLHFLSKSNIKGNKNSRIISVLLSLLVISITVISCFSVTMTGIMNDYKKDYRARTMYLSPTLKPVTEEAIKAIEELEHVERVVDATCVIQYDTFDIIDSSDKELSAKLQNKGNHVAVDSLYEGETKRVIKGKTLDKAPAFSCLVPSIFYPFDDAFEQDFKDLDYIDGRTLIGETFTVKGAGDTLEFSYFTSPGEDGMCEQSHKNLVSPEYTLTVVGTYPCTYSTFGSYVTLIVSEETGKLMSEMAFKESNIDLETSILGVAEGWNTPSLHEYRIIVDDPANISKLFNVVRKEMGFASSNEPNDLWLDDTTKLMSTLFTKLGVFITAAVLFVSAVLLVQSSINAIRERKGTIGLMKAIGYKNHQIFASLIYEQIYMTLRAIFIGGIISAVIIFFANYNFSHGTFKELQYVIDLKYFFIFLGVSFAISLVIPLVTELLLLRKIVKIQPREAMSNR